MTLAFVFPGQGSQSVGMMQSFADLPGVRETFSQASELLEQDLWKLAAEGPAEELNLTANTQPVMLVAGMALYRAWQARAGLAPAIMAGTQPRRIHRPGGKRRAGICRCGAAGAVSRPRDAGSGAGGVGAIAAILGLDDDEVRAACAEASGANEVAEAANFNSPVASGHRRQQGRCGTWHGNRESQGCQARGATADERAVALQSHAASGRAHARTNWAPRSFRRGAVPVLHNADVKCAESADDDQGRAGAPDDSAGALGGDGAPNGVG